MAVPHPHGGIRTFALVIAFAVSLRMVLLLFLPPLVDVYYYDTQAVHAFLSASNPYGHPYVGIPAWLVTSGAANVYAYLPGVLLFLAPFGALWDIRLGLVAADLVVAWGLYALKGPRSGVAAAAFLLAPWAFVFSTSYPNNSLVAMAFLGLALLWETKGREVPAAAALGVSLASSQFVWLLYPFFLQRALKGRRFVVGAVSILVAACLLLPFLVWNPSAFIYDTVTFQFARPSQSIVTPESFGLNFNPTLSGIAQTLFGGAVPVALRVVVLLAVLVYLLYRGGNLPRLVLNASVFLLVAIFILPSDFSWWYLELPFQTLLVWLVLSGGENGSVERGQPATNA